MASNVPRRVLPWHPGDVTGVGAIPLGRVLPRRAASIVADALADTRVVLVIGARQCGKSTLVRLQARDRSAECRNLDSAVTRQAAASDPTGFVAFGELMVIDEIQRVPELLLAIKEQVDADPRPGRYMLTGSAGVLGLRALPDTLPGRTETVELWPFSQGEIDGLPDGFVDAAFTEAEALNHTSTVSRSEYAERILRGGFPEAVARANPARRERLPQWRSPAGRCGRCDPVRTSASAAAPRCSPPPRTR